jgi:predicted secreted hydrolase
LWYNMVMKKIEFPRDEQAHDKIIEWWYWNGHLQGDDGNRYAFMDCLFQADIKKVKLPFLKSPFAKTYFSHSILSDIKNQRSYPDVDYISLLSRDSFRRPLLFVNYIDANVLDGYAVAEMAETSPFNYRLRTERSDLSLTAKKKPLLEGGDGFLKLGDRSTYYYSLTDLETRGTIRIGKKEIKVKGKSWMDHQWADAPYAKDEWNWFSLQLNNNVEIVCFEVSVNGKKTAMADICFPNGKSEHLDSVRFFSQGGKWRSAKTGAAYPLSWRIEIPEKRIVLNVEPLIKKQEMIFGTLNYWEGPLDVRGTIGGRKVSGQGFLELVGRPSQYKTYNFLKEGLSKTVASLRKKF